MVVVVVVVPRTQGRQKQTDKTDRYEDTIMKKREIERKKKEKNKRTKN